VPTYVPAMCVVQRAPDRSFQRHRCSDKYGHRVMPQVPSRRRLTECHAVAPPILTSRNARGGLAVFIDWLRVGL
jgi:hypothetical protein